MAIPTTNISLKDHIAAEAGDTTAPYPLSNYAGMQDTVPKTGRLGINRFRGKTKKTGWAFGSANHDKVLINGKPLASYVGQYSSTAYQSINLDSEVADYVGTTGRLVFRYKQGSSYTGDVQIDAVTIGSTFYSFETGNDGWQVLSANGGTTSDYESLTWGSLLSNVNAYQFSRDTAGTPSSNTGLTIAADGAYYIYAETSYALNTSNYVWLRSPAVTLNSATLRFYLGRYGATIGQLDVFWIPN